MPHQFHQLRRRIAAIAIARKSEHVVTSWILSVHMLTETLVLEFDEDHSSGWI